RQHRGEDRPVDEESRKVHGVFLARPSGTRHWGRGARPRAGRGGTYCLGGPGRSSPREGEGTGRIGGLCAAAGVDPTREGVVTARTRLRARATAACSWWLFHRDRLRGRRRGRPRG